MECNVGCSCSYLGHCVAAIFEVFCSPGAVKMDSQTAPGGVKIDPWRVPGGSWKPLSTSGGVLGSTAGIQEGSRSRLGSLLGPSGSHFGGFSGSLFLYFLGAEFGTSFYVDFNEFWGLFRGAFLRGSEHNNQLLVGKLNMQNVLKTY